MALLVTDAIVLHAFDYLETSRIVRLATREAGVQSVLARGARSSRKRFGSALDLFAEGQAQLQLKPGRDLHTLVSFDVTRSRPQLATDLGRFAAASAFGECVLRVVHEEAAPFAYERVAAGFDQIAASTPATCVSVALGALWRIVADAGFTPSIEHCASCHADLPDGEDADFSHVAGGALCRNCGVLSPGRRRLPASARQAIQSWLEGNSVALESAATGRAHQRLLREFIAQHLPDPRPLTAFGAWEASQYGT